MLILSQNTSFSPEQFQFLSEPEPGLFQQQPVISQLLHVQQWQTEHVPFQPHMFFLNPHNLIFSKQALIQNMYFGWSVKAAECIHLSCVILCKYPKFCSEATAAVFCTNPMFPIFFVSVIQSVRYTKQGIWRNTTINKFNLLESSCAKSGDRSIFAK